MYSSEQSLHSARHVLTRRSAIGLAGAMAAGTMFGDAIQDRFEYVFRKWEYSVGGVSAWIPVVGVDAVNFFGVDRAHTSDYAGTLVVSAIDRENGIITLSSEADG